MLSIYDLKNYFSIFLISLTSVFLPALFAKAMIHHSANSSVTDVVGKFVLLASGIPIVYCGIVVAFITITRPESFWSLSREELALYPLMDTFGLFTIQRNEGEIAKAFFLGRLSLFICVLALLICPQNLWPATFPISADEARATGIYLFLTGVCYVAVFRLSIHLPKEIGYLCGLPGILVYWISDALLLLAGIVTVAFVGTAGVELAQSLL